MKKVVCIEIVVEADSAGILDGKVSFLDKVIRAIDEYGKVAALKEVSPVTITLFDTVNDYIARKEVVPSMKLTTAIAMALAGLMYIIVSTIWPDFPITREQFQEAFIWLLLALGVQIAEVRARAYAIRRNWKGFMKSSD